MPREEEELVSGLEEEAMDDDPVDEDAEEEEEARPPVGVGARMPQAAAPPSATPKKKSGKKVRQPARGTIPKDADKSTEADLVWVRVIDELMAEGIDASMVKIKVSRIDHGAPNGIAVGYIQGDEVIGDGHSTTPADALHNAIEDIHTSSNVRGPQTYKVSFLLRGQPYTSGTIRLASPEEISFRRRNQGGMNMPMGMGMGMPPRPMPMPRAPQSRRDTDDAYEDDRRGGGGGGGGGYRERMQRGVGRLPEQEYYGGDPEVMRLRDEMRDLKEMVRDVLRAGVGAAPPQQPQGLTLELVNQFAELAAKFGLKLTPQQVQAGLGAVLPQIAHPPAAPPVTLSEAEEFEREQTHKIRSRIAKTQERLMDKMFDKLLNDEEEEEDASPPAPPSAPEDPNAPERDETVAWSEVPGTKVRYARDRDTGQIDWGATGVGLAPIAIEKLGPKALDVASKFLDAMQRQQQMPPQEELHGEVVGVGRPQQPHFNGYPPPPPMAEGPPPTPPSDDDFKTS